ncbi:jmjC domain-containing protein E-like [Stylophora pistillata]|uniref:jmjC domain-containing protein E-like n=1 Tax=Stylophora pistillata TaxID=50429 RepID=UPI000C045BA7|nr:jmjC domain-containing protein E-like [Stylophora pistillata]
MWNMKGTRTEIIFTVWFVFVTKLNASQGNLEGHLKPIFSHGKRVEVEVYDGFPTAEEFYRRFVDVPKPVLLRGAARLFPAFSLWNDEYFLSFTEGEEVLVTVEVDKKENRLAPGEDIPFADFVRDIHSSGKYMISSVPEFLRKDILLPFPIACHDITQGNLVQEILWFSSGGTKSVLHNDHAENIMCVFQGTKEFFLIDSAYQEQV